MLFCQWTQKVVHFKDEKFKKNTLFLLVSKLPHQSFDLRPFTPPDALKICKKRLSIKFFNYKLVVCCTSDWIISFALFNKCLNIRLLSWILIQFWVNRCCGLKNTFVFSISIEYPADVPWKKVVTVEEIRCASKFKPNSFFSRSVSNQTHPLFFRRFFDDKQVDLRQY